ncbi:MAG: polynucleotide adenylyltransferase PcnB [Chromatiales bacterium]|nr:polynucleotide adenylyltransferase PcnB [Chromatiales bacterium]
MRWASNEDNHDVSTTPGTNCKSLKDLIRYLLRYPFRLAGAVYNNNQNAAEPRVYARSEHPISRANISQNALKVLYRLHEAGYQAFLVGGGVRDLLLGREPKDFDIATDARPEQVRELFRNCRLIGRRFRLAHVHFGREIIEVATFRAPHEDDDEASEAAAVTSDDGRILRDNVYGTLDQDAWRRDFTINALYYNIADFSVVDFVGGMKDLEAGRLRLIGDPDTRFREDPVRMLRAVRFAAKLGFRIDPAVEAGMHEFADLLAEISPARLFDEVLKLFHGGSAVQTFEMLRHYGLFEHLFPLTEEALAHEEEGFPVTFVLNALANTDARINEDRPVTPAFLFAALLWEPLRHEAAAIMAEDGVPEIPALQQAAHNIMSLQQRATSIPKRFGIPMREIWTLQPRFRHKSRGRALRLAAHPRFRAAYDFLCLRSRSGELPPGDCQWWTEFQETDAAGQQKLLAGAGNEGKGSGKPRRRRRRRPPKKGGGGD